MVKFKKKKIRPLERKVEKTAFSLFRQGRRTGSNKVRDRRMRAWVGTSITTIAKVWLLLKNKKLLSAGVTLERLLWALLLLKSYDTDENNASRVGGVDEGTFNQYSWWIIKLIASLETDVVRAKSAISG